MTISRQRVRTALTALLVCVVGSFARAAVAAPADGTITGRVTSSDGATIARAVISVRGAVGERSSRTDGDGAFTISGLPAGSYALRVAAPGYDELADRTIAVDASRATDVTFTLARSASSLVTIGRVVANASSLSTSSAPSTTLNAQAFAADGYTRISDVLQNDISTTLVHPLGGSTILPTSVALRGPDPTETLVDIDGHQVNNGNTGDFDLSLLDPADYGSIELVRGISPSSLIGPDTIDGAINIRTLEPTTNPHGLLRVSAGSFDAFGQTVQSTGTYDRLGYALSLHRTTSSGEIDQTIVDADSGRAEQIGSGVDASTALGKLRYAFGRGGDGYAEFSFHDQSQRRDLSAALSSVGQPGPPDAGDDAAVRRLDDSVAEPSAALPEVTSFAGTFLRGHNAGYGLDVRVPLGAADADGIAHTSAVLRHYTSFVSQSVDGPGADSSPYLYNDRDRVDDETLELERTFSHASLTLAYDVRNERLATAFQPGVVNDEAIVRQAPGDAPAARLYARDDGAAAVTQVEQLALGQTQRAAVLRYTYDPLPNLKLTAAGYYSTYSTFGTSLDPRFGAVFTPDARSVVRFSVGTTYQAPQLPELLVPATLPNPVGGYVSVGNPALQPDRATEYGLGFEHVFEAGSHRTNLSVDFYRVNLRTPAALYLPPLDPACGPKFEGGDGTSCPLSYPVNAGDAVYQGFEISSERRLTASATLSAGYAVRSAYLTSVPAAIQDGTLVVGEQAQGLPLHKWTLTLANLPPLGFTYGAGLVYEGQYNELNQPPFTLLNAGLGYRFRAVEIGIAGTNLTNQYDQRFTHEGAGVAYGGLTAPLPSDAYALQGTAVTFTLTRRF